MLMSRLLLLAAEEKGGYIDRQPIRIKSSSSAVNAIPDSELVFLSDFLDAWGPELKPETIGRLKKVKMAFTYLKWVRVEHMFGDDHSPFQLQGVSSSYQSNTTIPRAFRLTLWARS
jgi:hypothetical protein